MKKNTLHEREAREMKEETDGRELARQVDYLIASVSPCPACGGIDWLPIPGFPAFLFCAGCRFSIETGK